METKEWWDKRATEMDDEQAWLRAQAQTPAGLRDAAGRRLDAMRADRGHYTDEEIAAAQAEYDRLREEARYA